MTAPGSPLADVRRALAAFALLVSCAAAATPSDGPLFEERDDVGLDFTHFNGMSGRLYFSEMVGSGVALLDYDGDGDLDVYLVQGSYLEPREASGALVFPPPADDPPADRLFRNDATAGASGLALRFVDVTEAAHLRATGYGMGVAVGDVDEDGDPDLYVTNHGTSELWRNRGDGTFEEVAAAAGVAHSGWDLAATFFDYDRDGRLDLYVGTYVEYRLAIHKDCFSQTGTLDYCGPLAYRPQPDALFHNLGHGRFEDVSAASGIASRPGSGLGAVTADFDGNGWVDLYVANDQMDNFLWLNQGDGRFVDEAVMAGAAVNADGQPEASMGVVAGDLDGDGSEDLFLTHLGRETNTLYLNDGKGFFRDATHSSGLGLPSWSSTGFGVALFDVDNDGLQDLFVANGSVRRIDEQARAGDAHPLHEPNQLFRNVDGRSFEEISAAAGLGLRSEVSRGVAVGDLDEDGDSDLVVTNNAGPVRLLENRRGSQASWCGVRVTERPGGRDSLGASVTVREGGRSSVRRVRTDGSYLAASDARVRVGLGSGAGRSVEAEVAWPDGRRSRFVELPVERHVTVSRPAGEASGR